MVSAVDIIEEKEKWIKELKKCNSELLNATSDYKGFQARLWLETDFEEVLNKKRPTVDEKKAYVTSKTLPHRDLRDIALYNKEYVLKMIDLCDDKLGVCDE